MAEEQANGAPDKTPTGSGIIAGALREIELKDIDFEDDSLMFRTALRTGPLVQSLKTEGLQIPVVLRGRRPGRGKKFQIISGFRRCTAAKELEWDAITALVRPSDFSEEEAFKASVLENTERKTYSDIDRAYVMQAYRSRGLGSVDIGKLMGLSKRQATNIIGLLELPDSVQTAIDDPAQYFSATHGLTLKKLAGKYPQLEYESWVEWVNKDSLSVASLTRQVNAEYRPEMPAGFTSIFNSASTRLEEGEVRLMPIKFKVAELSPQEKKALKKELQALLGQL